MSDLEAYFQIFAEKSVRHIYDSHYGNASFYWQNESILGVNIADGNGHRVGISGVIL